MWSRRRNNLRRLCIFSPEDRRRGCAAGGLDARRCDRPNDAGIIHEVGSSLRSMEDAIARSIPPPPDRSPASSYDPTLLDGASVGTKEWRDAGRAVPINDAGRACEPGDTSARRQRKAQRRRRAMDRRSDRTRSDHRGMSSDTIAPHATRFAPPRTTPVSSRHHDVAARAR